MESLFNFINTHTGGFFSVAVAVLYILLAIGTTIHILLNKDDIKGSIGWIALVFLSPFIGTVLYIFLGINRVKRKGSKLRSKGLILENMSKKEKKERFEKLPLNAKQFIKFGFNVYNQNFTHGNNIKPLLNGVEAYPEMIKSIKKAKKEVLVESYIFDSDDETDKFIEAFKIAIKNGAKIKIIIDGIGTLKFFKRSIESKLSKIKGLKYSVFLPPQIPVAFAFINLRNHRKIMVIDGKIAFFGGMNLSKDNILIKDKKRGVLDITFKVEGPVIDQIAQVFEDDWYFAANEEMFSHSKILKGTKKGDMLARVIPDGPDKDSGKIELLIHGRINSAQKKIIIVTPYFLPENNILTALELAAMRGVDIEIILPIKSDHIIMNWAEEPNFKRLIEKGIKIYKTPRPFDHSKIFVIDNEWSFIGSANWDVRSFKLHFESNMEVLSKSFAKELTQIANQKRKKSKIVTLESIKKINILKRIRNNAFRLITPYY